MPQDLSAIGEAVLIAREGRRLTAYRDSVGVWTIGIGCTRIEGRPVRPGDTVTAAECDALFHATVAKYAEAVRSGLKVPVGQHTFDALVSIAYNIGIAGALGSTFLRRLNAGDMAGARDAILLWKKPPEIITRRQAEAEQFVTPYAQALPRATTTSRPIVRPVETRPPETLAQSVATAAARTVPAVQSRPQEPVPPGRPGLLARLLAWANRPAA